jgi:hypothetical protein
MGSENGNEGDKVKNGGNERKKLLFFNFAPIIFCSQITTVLSIEGGIER